MTFGKMNHIKKYSKHLIILLTVLIFSPGYALESKQESNIELTALLQSFSDQKNSTADFTEEKHTSFLEQPIKSSGYLQFIAPNKLYKFILAPEKISQKINGDELIIISANETYTVNLTEHPEFSVILRAIISLLSGDHAALIKDFKVIFESQPSSWTLLLSPHDSYISSYVESIKIFGLKNKLSKIIVTEPNHDRSITHIFNHR